MAVPSDGIRCVPRRARHRARRRPRSGDRPPRQAPCQPQAPGIGDALVGAADAALQCLAAIAQALLHERGRAARIGRQARGQLGLDALGQVQLDHARAGCGLHGMAAVGHDQHVGCGCVLAEQAQQQPSRAGDARGPQPRDGFQEGSRHGGRPGNESKALVERRRQSTRDKECAPRALRFGQTGEEKREPRLPRGPGGQRRYSRPDSAKEYGVPLPTMK